MQERFFHLVGEDLRRGDTVFLSSHALYEVQHVADRVGIDSGRAARAGRDGGYAPRPGIRPRRGDFRRASPGRTHLPASTGLSEDSKGEARRRVLALEGEIDALVKALAHFHVRALDVHEADLEDIFLALYRGGEPDAA